MLSCKHVMRTMTYVSVWTLLWFSAHFGNNNNNNNFDGSNTEALFCVVLIVTLSLCALALLCLFFWKRNYLLWQVFL